MTGDGPAVHGDRFRAVWVIPSSIDPLSAKNQHLDEGSVRAILVRIGRDLARSWRAQP